MKREPLAVMLITLAVAAAPIALAEPGTPMVECANHTHVWSADQCPQSDARGPGSFPSSGGGGGGLGGLLHKLTGGLL